MRCCERHVDPADGTCEDRVPFGQWCLNSAQVGREPCCDECPDFEWE